MRYSPVKVKIIERGQSIRAFAARHGLNVWLVYKVLSGERHNAEVQEKIAEVLGEEGAKLFGADWHASRRVSERRAS